MTSKARRLALIVASSKFTDKTLQQLVAPGQDAADLARVLEDAAIGGFEVKRLINHPSHEVRREIEAFFANRKRDDLLLLYFSGHGVKDDDGRLYLATTDTQRGLFRSTAVPAAFVNETMTASRSRRQVLILDCCHSGAFARGMVAKGGESVDIRDRFEGRGRVVLTASNATQYAFQGDDIIGEGSRSVFTRHLVRGLESGEADRDGDGWVSLDELYDYVYDRVTDETPQQTPSKWTFDLQGEIVVARNPHWVVKPVELPLKLQQAIENPFAGVREGVVRELDRLLRGSHPGLALAAHTALTHLVDDDSRRVSATAAESLAAYAEAEQEARSKKQEEVEAERLAAQKAEAERAAREKAEQERLAREKAEQERQAREKAEQERLAREKAEQERQAREKAEQERLAREKAEQERQAREKAEQERLAREKAEQERQAREKAEQERLAREKAEQERQAREKAEQERLAREKAEQERLAREKAEQERLAREKAEEDRLATQYAEGTNASTAGQWEQALRCFERLEAERPGYRDAAEQVARLRRLIAAMEPPVGATCPTCGATARPGARFCPGCGKSLTAELAPPTLPPASPRPTTLPEEDRRPKPRRPRPGRLPEE